MSEQERQPGAPSSTGRLTVSYTVDTTRLDEALRRTRAWIRRALRQTRRQRLRRWFGKMWRYWFAPLEPGGYWTEKTSFLDRLRWRLSRDDMEGVRDRGLSAADLGQMTRVGVDTIPVVAPKRTLTPAELAAFRDAYDLLFHGPGHGTNGRRISWWRRAGARALELLGELLDQID